MCRVCGNSFPNCPACSPEPRYEECERCKGQGYYFIDDEGEEYQNYEEGLSKEDCPDCDSNGYIEIY